MRKYFGYLHFKNSLLSNIAIAKLDFSLLLPIQLLFFQLCDRKSDSNSCCSFTLLKALAKSDGNLIDISFKSQKERQLSRQQQLEELYLQKESHKKISKELIPKRMQRGSRVITLQGAIEKRFKIKMAYLANYGSSLDCRNLFSIAPPLVIAIPTLQQQSCRS